MAAKILYALKIHATFVSLPAESSKRHHPIQIKNSSNMNIFPQELCNVVLGKLASNERVVAQGTFSSPSLPLGYDNTALPNPINVWFQGNVTSNHRKMILQHNDIAAILLLYNGKFQIISKPSMQMNMATRDEYILGHFGDALSAIIPVAINTLDITLEFYGLLPQVT